MFDILEWNETRKANKLATDKQIIKSLKRDNADLKAEVKRLTTVANDYETLLGFNPEAKVCAEDAHVWLSGVAPGNKALRICSVCGTTEHVAPKE